MPDEAGDRGGGWPTVTGMRSHWVDLDGATHWVEVDGPPDAPPIVAVHGLGGSHANWLALAPLLASDYRVFAIDLAGHGHTYPDHRGTDVLANRDLLDLFLAEVVGEPATLLGNSMGGLIALLQAAARPDTVRDLVLIGPALPLVSRRMPEPIVALGVAATGVPRLGSWLVRRRRTTLSPEVQVGEMLALCCVDPDRVPTAVVDRMVAMVRERSEVDGLEVGLERAARSTVSSVLNRRRYDAVLGRVRAPTLVLHGEQDRLVPVESSRRVAAGRPDWTLVTRPDLGHVPQLEDPQWTADTIRAWHAAQSMARASSSVGGSEP